MHLSAASEQRLAGELRETLRSPWSPRLSIRPRERHSANQGVLVTFTSIPVSPVTLQHLCLCS